jgi:hypothetical protein
MDSEEKQQKVLDEIQQTLYGIVPTEAELSRLVKHAATSYGLTLKESTALKTRVFTEVAYRESVDGWKRPMVFNI